MQQEGASASAKEIEEVNENICVFYPYINHKCIYSNLFVARQFICDRLVRFVEAILPLDTLAFLILKICTDMQALRDKVLYLWRSHTLAI